MEGPSIHRLNHHRHRDGSAMFHFQYIVVDVHKVRNYSQEEEISKVQTKHVTSTEPLQNGDESPSPFAECDARTRRSERPLWYLRSEKALRKRQHYNECRDNRASADALWTDNGTGKATQRAGGMVWDER
jgi:hypothetical protein